LCPVSFWSLIVFLFCFPMIKRTQNKKTIIDQKETEQKDNQWSKRNRTKGLSMIKRKQNKKTINDRFVFFWLLIIFLFCFLLIIDSLCILFPLDHWFSVFVFFWSLIFSVFTIINDQRETEQKTINDKKDTEQKDYYWSKGNRTKR
jgi:Na+/H+ antiporter NhaD/arsenite permease-like protein